MVTLLRAAALTGFAGVMRALGGDAEQALRRAVMLGYRSHSAFTRWFSAEFGCAPWAWRNKT